MSNWAIIVAAGRSVRFGSDLPKQFQEVAGRPLLAWTLAAFEKANSIDEIVTVTSEDYQLFVTQKVINPFKLGKVGKVINGGGTRRESVFNGLKALPSTADVVAIHDGVRPLVKPDDIDRVVALAGKHKAAMLAVPVKDTVKQVENGIIVDTLVRENIWLAQTPQAFDYHLIFEAHQEFALTSDTAFASDDSILIEKMGIKVRVVEPSASNIKVTTPEDLAFVESILGGYLHD